MQINANKCRRLLSNFYRYKNPTHANRNRISPPLSVSGFRLRLVRNPGSQKQTFIPQLESSNLKPRQKTSTASLSMSSSMASSASQSADENEGFDLLKCSTVQEGKKDAEIRLPLGYRFDPTGDEILVYYLFNKIMDRAMPNYDLIKEVDVYECDPNQLPNGDFRHTADFNAAYYFANREPFDAREGKIIKTATNGGYWKVIDDEEEVLFEDSNVIVGFETVMKFYKGQAPNGTKTPFVMNEYRLNPRVVPAHVLNESIKNKIERYVVCQIINKEVSNQPAIEYGQGLLELLQKSSAGTVEDGSTKVMGQKQSSASLK